MEHGRYIVVEGAIGAGKAALAEKIAQSLGARSVLERSEDNPFLALYLKERDRFAFQTQVFFLLSRFRQQQELSQLNLFHRGTVADYLFEKDRIFALINLGEEEFRLYDQMFALLLDRVPPPDLVVYLSARTDVLWRRLVGSGQEGEWFSQDYLRELNEAYNYFFFHYDRAPLLVVNTSEVDFLKDEDNFQHLLKEIRSHQKGVKQYIPLGSTGADTRKTG